MNRLILISLWLTIASSLAFPEQSELPGALPGNFPDKADAPHFLLTDSLRTGYIAFWQSLPSLQVAPQNLQSLGQLITLFPNQSDASFVKRLLLSLFHLRHSSGAIPVDQLFDYLHHLFDPEEMIRFLDVERTRKAFRLDPGLTDQEAAMAYMRAIAARLNLLEIVSGAGDRGTEDQVELRIRTQSGLEEDILILFNKRKSGPRQLTLRIAEGSRISLRRIGDESDQRAMLAQITRRRWFTGAQLSAELLAQIEHRLAASGSPNDFTSVVADLHGVSLQGHHYKIPFTAKIDQLTLIPGHYYTSSEENCKPGIPMFLFLPVTIHLGIIDPQLIKTLLF